jgi:uncharacterized repeat protein (TIGR01451 family)
VAVAVVPLADLSVTKTASDETAEFGDNLTYTIEVRNLGPSAATGVTVNDALPGGVTYVSAIASGGSCSEFTGTVTCSLGSILAGSNESLTVVVATAGEGTIVNTVEVTALEDDPDESNNTAVAGVTVGANPDEENDLNNPPSIPELVIPSDGETSLPTTLLFGWNSSEDPDGDSLGYSLYYCEDTGFVGCEPVENVQLAAKGILSSGFWNFGGLVFVAFAALAGS